MFSSLHYNRITFILIRLMQMIYYSRIYANIHRENIITLARIISSWKTFFFRLNFSLLPSLPPPLSLSLSLSLFFFNRAICPLQIDPELALIQYRVTAGPSLIAGLIFLEHHFSLKKKKKKKKEKKEKRNEKEKRKIKIEI